MTAPSSGVEPACQARLDVVLAHLRARGYTVVEGHCVREDPDSAPATREKRAAELMEFLQRKDIDAVLPPWGGDYLIEVLPLLDFDALASAPPKWVLGYSDVSTFTLALTLRTGIATAHGPNLMDLAPGQGDPLTSAALNLLVTPAGASFEQFSSNRWQAAYEDFRSNPAATFQLTETTRWRALDDRVRHSLAGRLIGGCIDTISRLVGTPYGDVPAFVRRHHENGTILFLESCEYRPPELVRALWSLRLAGWFEGLTGMLIGRSTGPDPTDFGQHDALRRALGDLDIPVLLDVDCGHRPPQMLLINGAHAKVHFEDGAGIVTQTLT